jgi:hypothetical protein
VGCWRTNTSAVQSMPDIGFEIVNGIGLAQIRT